ncbi:SPFH domain-containing protein [Brachybacterium huguangmaarense]|uniref:SPFH domain-containing protein n=1 Tax=Brachybacterium huguangmaarense TaxID=1652028 RepID=A0ABY6G210_9MICO|nr:SPFH domain-containing protein [Brachybacterium huguangmaarense]UYG16841.1 SPFH domain-containing protein [Brachybacterium huguangmaarense]
MDPTVLLALVIAAAAVVVVLIIVIALVRSYRIAAPNEALIITGRNAKAGDVDLESGGARVVIGGRAIVRPIFDRAFVMSLSSRQIQVEIEGYSKNGIFVRLRGVAQVKVGGNVDDVRKASQRFLDQQGQIDHYSQEILSGTLRAVVGTLTVEQIIQDRASFAAQVQEEAEHSMNNQGLVIDTFQISAVEDDGTYLRDWGRPEAALVAKRAAIAESDANREATQARNINLQREAESKQELDLRQAEIKEQTDARQATADASGPLARAAQQQRIIEQEELIAIRNNDLREKQLIAEVHKPAEAKRYAEQQDADSKKYARVADSEAALTDERNRAEARKVTSQSEAFAIEARGRAEADVELQRRSKDAEAARLEGQAAADALRAQGEAEGASIRAKGDAEAESTRAKAEAYKEFNEAAILSQLLETLPQVARELASPYANIDSLSVVSSDGEAKIGRNISAGLAQVLDMVRSTTGVDFHDMLQRAAQGSAAAGSSQGSASSASAPSTALADTTAQD